MLQINVITSLFPFPISQMIVACFPITPQCNIPVRGYWMGDRWCNFGWRKEEEEEEGGDMRQAWLSSICCNGCTKVHLPFSQLRRVTADHSLYFTSLPSFLSFFSVFSSLTFSLSSSVLSHPLVFLFIFPVCLLQFAAFLELFWKAETLRLVCFWRSS